MAPRGHALTQDMQSQQSLRDLQQEWPVFGSTYIKSPGQTSSQKDSERPLQPLHFAISILGGMRITPFYS